MVCWEDADSGVFEETTAPPPELDDVDGDDEGVAVADAVAGEADAPPDLDDVVSTVIFCDSKFWLS